MKAKAVRGSRAAILAELQKHNRRKIRVKPGNPFAIRVDNIDRILERVIRNPEKVRLTNSDAKLLSEAWRRYEHGTGWAARYNFNGYSEFVRRWYRRQTNRARKLIGKTPFNSLVGEFDKLSARAAKKHGFAFIPTERGGVIRKFSDPEAFERFVTLPHYKSALDTLTDEGRFSFVRYGRKGEVEQELVTVDLNDLELPEEIEE